MCIMFTIDLVVNRKEDNPDRVDSHRTEFRVADNLQQVELPVVEVVVVGLACQS